ncbi:MAG: flagellar biosynthesis anti-sigma factor FlgM [Chloroflexi bacterium]|nr:flagellar biosynthesis anti-sigma factor FlgM [Chloroflexota bacterium]
MNVDRLRNDLIRLYGGRSSSAREAGAAGAGRAEQGAAPTRGDSVSLSPQLRELRRILHVIRRLPDVREERVAQLRQQIADGTYRINDEQIARALAGGRPRPGA